VDAGAQGGYGEEADDLEVVDEGEWELAQKEVVAGHQP
jgi:hypothetical protein